jgi:hypothetical protein
MKKILYLFILISILHSCSKNDKQDSLTLNETIPGGCAIENQKEAKLSYIFESDTSRYRITQNKLDLFAGFHATCCGKYSTNTKITNDSILIDIISIKPGSCDCICYYTFNFEFVGLTKTFNYLINYENDETFVGTIKF